MGYEYFSFADIPAFLEMAAAEGWISFEWELKFLLDNFPSGCFVLREGDKPVAFVTSIKYDKSGWIGNLIVKDNLRGKGVGTALMKKALDALLYAGTDTIWLTASPSGRPVYERLGFVEIDVVKRWSGKVIGGHAERLSGIPAEDVLILDGLGWGDGRRALIDAVLVRGEMLGVADGFIVIQDCGNFRQLGPFACAGEKSAPLLLDTALSVIGKSCEVILDAPGKNDSIDPLLSSRNFRCVGRTCLMYAGVAPAYNPRNIFALGSMGSMG